MSETLIMAIVIYLGLMFLLAHWVEKRADWAQNLGNGANRYTLSLAVYCTAWTYYGSVGLASRSGLDFLAIYLGPVIAMPVWMHLGKRIIQITKSQRISTLAEFIAARYGKNRSLEILVAVFSIIGVLPYISLQIKALSESYGLLAGFEKGLRWWAYDPALYLTTLLLAFTLLFGTRYLEANKPRKGLVSVIAFESLFKLFALILSSTLVFRALYGQWEGFAEAMASIPVTHSSFQFSDSADWFWMLIASAFAFFLLPRQFQVGVVENNNINHLNRAAWLLPVYLLVINLPILPIVFSGERFLSSSFGGDYALLELSLISGGFAPILVFLGGFSAATSMIIVSSIALGNMLSTNVVLPALLARKGDNSLRGRILFLRRISLTLVFALAFLFYRSLSSQASLVSIGMVSFIAMMQFAPAFIGGLFWINGNIKGALLGISIGFAIWAILLLSPMLGIYDLSNFFIMAETQTGLGPLSLSIVLSLGTNSCFYILGSWHHLPNVREKIQAELFVRSQRFEKGLVEDSLWTAGTLFTDIRSLLMRFLGDRRTTEVLDRYARIHKIDWASNPKTDARMATYAERLLTEAIGPSSARIMVAQVVQESELGFQQVVDILEESKEIHRLNRNLQAKQRELEEATDKLLAANERLESFSKIKDDFLYTVTHELRTPLAAIRSQAELVRDTDDMDTEDQSRFLDNIVVDCERLTRLINDILDLERYESGNQKLSLSKHQIIEVIQAAVSSIDSLLREKHIQIHLDIAPSTPSTYLDFDRIQQVLINLLNNSIKYSPAGEGHIHITAYPFEHSIKVNISDNGSGISKDEMLLVFDKFYQVRNQTRKKPNGSGLGLAICRNIVQMHQGKIWIEPNLPQGTKVCITLPLYTPQSLKSHHLGTHSNS